MEEDGGYEGKWKDMLFQWKTFNNPYFVMLNYLNYKSLNAYIKFDINLVAKFVIMTVLPIFWYLSKYHKIIWKKNVPTLVYTVELFWIELYQSICDTLSWFTLVNCVKAENL